tara:strand:- start:243 stop:467 length:225 start_codon:yes stop_codon:yes gene_type:complete
VEISTGGRRRSPGSFRSTSRIGIPSAESVRFEGDELQKTSFNEAISTLEDAGAEISEIDFSPLFAIAEMLYAGC